MNTLRKMMVPAAALSALLLLAGCASSSGEPEGTWGVDDGPNLTLADDGSLSGTDGCNRLMGSWTADGDTIDFGEVASTLMACEGVDTWLNGLATGTVNGDTITVLDGSGAEIGTLARQ